MIFKKIQNSFVNPFYLYNFVKTNFFLTECSDYNSKQIRINSRTKEQARTTFEKNDIPHAKGIIFINPFRAFKFVKKNGFPVVLKPNMSGFSRGSFFPINNYKEFIKSLFLVKFFWPKTILEQYLDGENYRVVVNKKGVIAVTKRYPAYVIGNGINNISELIKIENKIRKEMNLFPVMNPIDESNAFSYMKKNNSMNLNNIPKDGNLIKLGNKITLKSGGIIKNISLDKIPKSNLEICEKILKIFNANILGIDVIMEKGINIDYKKQKCIFLEVNPRPYIKMHSYPRFGKPINIKKIMED